MEITCVVCPVSCLVTVVGKEGTVQEIENYGCNRGRDYAINEFLAPKRMLTSLVKAKDYKMPVIPVKTSVPIPKEKIFQVMDIIRTIEAEPPYAIGKVIVQNILGTGSNIVLCNE
jgi:CxxC motif-containing protein